MRVSANGYLLSQLGARHLMNHNLFAALQGAFPEDRTQMAVETEAGRIYSWADLERGAAQLANLFRLLSISEDSRILIQADKSVEAS